MRPRKGQLDLAAPARSGVRSGSGPGGPVNEWLLYIDGAARGNPGPAAAAAVLYEPGGRRKAEKAAALGKLTNNAAEYEALEIGLKLARESGAARLEVRSDSELLVRQMQGAYRVRSEHLKEAAARVHGLAADFSAVRYTAIPRELNQEADRLANKALDAISRSKRIWR